MHRWWTLQVPSTAQWVTQATTWSVAFDSAARTKQKLVGGSSPHVFQILPGRIGKILSVASSNVKHRKSFASHHLQHFCGLIHNLLTNAWFHQETWGMNHAWNHPLFRHEAGGEAGKLQDPCQKPEGVHRLLSHAAYFLGYWFCLPVSLCFEKYEKCFPCEFCSCMSDFAKSPSGSRIFVWKLIDSSAVLSVLSWPSNGHRYGSAWPSTEQHPATFCNTPLKLTQSKSHQENQML